MNPTKPEYPCSNDSWARVSDEVSVSSTKLHPEGRVAVRYDPVYASVVFELVSPSAVSSESYKEQALS